MNALKNFLGALAFVFAIGTAFATSANTSAYTNPTKYLG